MATTKATQFIPILSGPFRVFLIHIIAQKILFSISFCLFHLKCLSLQYVVLGDFCGFFFCLILFSLCTKTIACLSDDNSLTSPSL